MIDDSAVYGFLDEYKLRCGITERYIDLSSEVGELGKELLKATDYGKVDFRMTADTEQELGDCLFSPQPLLTPHWQNTCADSTQRAA